MICETCKLEIDNTKGGFMTLSGKHYHAEWFEEIKNDDGEVIEIIEHENCYP